MLTASFCALLVGRYQAKHLITMPCQRDSYILYYCGAPLGTLLLFYSSVRSLIDSLNGARQTGYSRHHTVRYLSSVGYIP